MPGRIMDLLDDLTMVLLPSLRPQNAKETGTSWEGRICKPAWSERDVKNLGQKKDGVSRLVEDCSSNQPTYPRLKILNLVPLEFIER